MTKDKVTVTVTERAIVGPTEQSVEEVTRMLKSRPTDFLSPDWRACRRCHEWKNYVPADLVPLWPTLTPEVRAILASDYQRQADSEEWD